MQALALTMLQVALFGFEGVRDMLNMSVGVDCGEGPPVPIPNTEVKLFCAESTWLETTREDRYMPVLFHPLVFWMRGLFLCGLMGVIENKLQNKQEFLKESLKFGENYDFFFFRYEKNLTI